MLTLPSCAASTWASPLAQVTRTEGIPEVVRPAGRSTYERRLNPAEYPTLGAAARENDVQAPSHGPQARHLLLFEFHMLYGSDGLRPLIFNSRSLREQP